MERRIFNETNVIRFPPSPRSSPLKGEGVQAIGH